MVAPGLPSNMTNSTDDIFRTPQPNLVDFAFDQRVVDVFPDMIRRSVPAYETVVPLSALLAARHVPGGGTVFDLGCSRGATTAALLRFCAPGVQVVAVDNSAPMIEAAQAGMTQLVGAEPASRVQWQCSRLQDVPITNADAVVMNYTLQFIPPAEREQALRHIAAGLVPGAPLIYAEKVVLDDPLAQDWANAMHLEFKRANGYSELEVAQKRTALEKVMIPDTVNTHLRRLETLGLERPCTWFSCLNWAAFIAYAPGAERTTRPRRDGNGLITRMSDVPLASAAISRSTEWPELQPIMQARIANHGDAPRWEAALAALPAPLDAAALQFDPLGVRATPSRKDARPNMLDAAQRGACDQTARAAPLAQGAVAVLRPASWTRSGARTGSGSGSSRM